jgi:predicted DNA-binding ArsR family transcriptional regulator
VNRDTSTGLQSLLLYQKNKIMETPDLAVTSNNKISKAFEYKKGKVQLSFSLGLDTKSELKDFLELLKVAQSDVEEELNKIK